MATILQLRRGTTVQHSTFTGAVGEVTVDTTKDTIVVHDGTTAGGFPLAKESAIADFATLSDISVTDSGGDGSLSYNSTTGVITYTGPSATEVRAHFSAGTGITITNGAVAVDSTIATKTYADTAASNAAAALVASAPSISTALGNRLRIDVNTQSLTSQQKANALTNLGITADVTEINYIDGVTSAIQTQLDAKAPSANPSFTGTVTLPGTTSVGNVSSTELGYLDGVTSAIQTQLDSKLASSSYTAADVLSKLLTVDGSGSGLDADLLDGQSGAYYRINVYNSAGTLLN
jgi:hypothetical protein